MKMNRSVDDKIADVLKIDVEKPQETEVVKYEPKEIVQSNAPAHERDFEWSRENIMMAISTGQNSLEELFELAKQSQQPRAFEVISHLIKTITEANKDLIELHRKKLDMDPERIQGKTVNQNLFVGSTKELMEIIKKKDEPTD